MLEPASFLVTRMQIGGRAFDRHALPRDERALEFEAIGFRVAGVCHELSELRVTFAIDEGRVADALPTLLPGVEGGQVNTPLVVQEVEIGRASCRERVGQ